MDPSSSSKAKAKTSKAKSSKSEWDQLKAMMLPKGFGLDSATNKTNKANMTNMTDMTNKEAPAPVPPAPDSPPSSPEIGPTPLPPPPPTALPPPPLPPTTTDTMPMDIDSHSDSDSNHDSDSDTDHPPDDLATLPLTHTFPLPTSPKPLLSLACDPSGTRLATGSADTSLRLFDFAGLSPHAPRPFKSLDPKSNSDAAPQPIVDLAWSPAGDALLVATSGGCQALVYSREGAKVCELAKGDMYIRDLRRTDGHTAGVTSVAWDPLVKGVCATGSSDGTVRIWDVAKPKKSRAVIVYRQAPRVGVTCVAYARNGAWIAAGASDGSVRVWKAAGPSYSVPACDIASVSGAGGVIAVEFSGDPRVLFVRYEDGTVARWNLAPSATAPADKLAAKLAQPAATSPGLPLHAHVGGNLALSPSDTLVLIGGLDPAAPDPRTAPGRLLVLDARTLAPVTHVDLDAQFGGAGRVHWSTRTNQVMAATAAGACVVLYSDKHSDRGVKLCVARAGAAAGRRTKWVDDELEQVLLERAGAELEVAAQRMAKGKGKKGMGNALVQVHGGRVSKRQLAAIRGDVVPAKRVAERGRLAAHSEGGGAIFFAQEDAHSKPPMDRDVDPREAILKYAEAAASDPYWITPAYKATQPEQVLAEKVVEEDEEERVIAKEDKQKVLRRRDF